MLAERSPEVVLISHLHYDHADMTSLRMLPRGTLVVAPGGSGRYLGRKTGLEIHEVRAGDRLQFADVEITAVPAVHGEGLSLPRPTTACLGFALRNSMSVYFAGDTELFEGMRDVGREFDLDLALLPVGGYSPRLGAGHLNPRTAAEALLRLKPRVAVPIHWGAMRLPGPHALWKTAHYLKRPPHTFARHALLLSPETDVRILQPGESTTVN